MGQHYKYLDGFPLTSDLALPAFEQVMSGEARGEKYFLRVQLG